MGWKLNNYPFSSLSYCLKTHSPAGTVLPTPPWGFWGGGSPRGPPVLAGEAEDVRYGDAWHSAAQGALEMVSPPRMDKERDTGGE